VRVAVNRQDNVTVVNDCPVGSRRFTLSADEDSIEWLHKFSTRYQEKIDLITLILIQRQKLNMTFRCNSDVIRRSMDHYERVALTRIMTG